MAVKKPDNADVPDAYRTTAEIVNDIRLRMRYAPEAERCQCGQKTASRPISYGMAPTLPSARVAAREGLSC
jgi:hypothetical protein